MKSPRILAAGTAISWALLAPAAYADLTAAQVWDDWRGYMQGMGYIVTADEASAGGQLAVSNINVGMEMADEGGAMNMSLGTLTFVEQGDGTVEMVMPAVLPLSVTVTPDDSSTPGKFDMSITQVGQKAVVSGTPEQMRYAYSADTMAINLDQMVADGESFGPDKAKIIVTLNDVTSTTDVEVGETRLYQQQMQTGTVAMDVYMDPPDEPTSIAFQAQTEGMQVAGTSNVPLEMISSDMKAMLDAGFGFDVTLTTGPGSTEATVVDGDGPMLLKSTSGGGNLTFKMDNAGIRYGGGQSDVTVEAQVPGLPFPVTFSMAKTGFNLEAPITQSDAPQSFGLGLSLEEFRMSDMIWGIFDPSGQLPRDPATVLVKLNGAMTLLVDFLDPEVSKQIGEKGARSAEIERLNIDQLRISAIGAELEGAGALTFDNADKETASGMPNPVGTINLSLDGGITLLDKLVEMGFVPQEQAMGARMMLGLFAIPAEGEDRLKSKIEFTEDGQILANGQRVK